MQVRHLKEMLERFPDNAELLIDGNTNGAYIAAVEESWSLDDPVPFVNLKLNEGWSVTKDEVVDGMVSDLRQRIKTLDGLDRSRDC